MLGQWRQVFPSSSSLFLSLRYSWGPLFLADLKVIYFLFFIFTFHFFHFFIISFQYFCCCCLIVTCKQPLLCDSLNNCFQPFIDYFHFLFVLIPEFFGSVLTFISNENIQLTRSANFIWCLCCLNIFFNEPTTLNTFTLAGQCYLHSKQAKHAICFQCHHCLGHQWH